MALLYIFWFLHQTTTWWYSQKWFSSCISFDSYIKPQPCFFSCRSWRVVYLLIPTSNHNLQLGWVGKRLLYTFWFLHQTTTSRRFFAQSGELYIFWFLHQTTTYYGSLTSGQKLYIFWFLHQTTTAVLSFPSASCCISFDSYIKPQHRRVVSIIFLSCISFDSYIKPQP